MGQTREYAAVSSAPSRFNRELCEALAELSPTNIAELRRANRNPRGVVQTKTPARLQELNLAYRIRAVETRAPADSGTSYAILSSQLVLTPLGRLLATQLAQCH